MQAAMQGKGLGSTFPALASLANIAWVSSFWSLSQLPLATQSCVTDTQPPRRMQRDRLDTCLVNASTMWAPTEVNKVRQLLIADEGGLHGGRKHIRQSGV